MREAARDLAGKLTEEEKRELERWAREWQRQSSTTSGGGQEAGSRSAPTHADAPAPPFEAETQDVDAHGDDEIGDRVLAEWLADAPIGGAGPTRARGEAMAREARRAADRAVNESAVHPRYHPLLQRYFQRFGETVEQAAKQSSTSAASEDAAP